MAAQPAATAALSERIVGFDCGGERLIGVLSLPAAAPPWPRSVLIAVGGPQYRVGSHRQFVLLARCLAAAGFPTLRFDYRGMGDSEGEPRGFEAVEEDLRAAIEATCRETGSGELVVVGLCDAASSALMFATGNARVRALVLLNPWLRDGAALAAAHIKHYYGARLMQPEFWRKLLAGRLDWRAALGSLLRDAGALRSRRRRREDGAGHQSFQSRMAAGWRRFGGPILLILSGKDMTASEFIEYTRQAPEWHGLLCRRGVERFDLPEADHTLSGSSAREAAERRVLDWLGTF